MDYLVTLQNERLLYLVFWRVCRQCQQTKDLKPVLVLEASIRGGTLDSDCCSNAASQRVENEKDGTIVVAK